MNNELDIILTLILISIAASAVLAYFCRDKNKDAAKQAAFLDSITGTGLFDKSSKSK